MLSFKNFIKEDPEDTPINKLIKLGYDVENKTGKKLIVSIKASNRVDDLIKIAKEIGGTYNPRGSGSSVGRVELKDGWVILVKPIGERADTNKVTDAVESAQCVYCASVWNNTDFSTESFKSLKDNYDIKVSLSEVESISDIWITSCINTAKFLHSLYKGKKYKFHHQSSFVLNIETQFKKLNTDGGKPFQNVNKWNPADIYMVSEVGSNVDFSKTESILELNDLLIKYLNSDDIIPISLKKVIKNVTVTTKNVVPHRPTYKFLSISTGTIDFMRTNAARLNFDGGNIDFRTFGTSTSWAGEIQGKLANHGKIGMGPLNHILKKHGYSISPHSTLKDITPLLMKEFYKYYTHFVKSNVLNEVEFKNIISEKTHTWWVSKFLSTQLMYYIDTCKEKDEITSAIISYAASESELSGPYIKIVA